jgi:hypothetical protein
MRIILEADKFNELSEIEIRFAEQNDIKKSVMIENHIVLKQGKHKIVANIDALSSAIIAMQNTPV